MTTTYTALDFQGKNRPIWCPGCGDHNVLSALYTALAQTGVDPKDVVIVSGIGCSGRLPGFVKCYGFHTLHGRALPVAVGVKAANPELTVVVVGGDGDGLGIGGGHLPHVARKNPDITYLLMDNSLYGQTKGQSSPTTPLGDETATAPYGNLDEPLNPVLLALAHNASFVARGYAGATSHEQLADLIYRGIQHKGFSFLHILSPCATFNRYETYRYYLAKVRELEADHNPQDRLTAMARAIEEEKLPLGVFYDVERPTYQESLDLTGERALREGEGDLEALLRRYAA